MKKILLLLIIVAVSSCNSLKKPEMSFDLYDVLTGDQSNGAAFNFYETITEPDEFNIILSDEILKRFVKKTDIETCNFILVNLGEKESEGYSIKVDKIEELPDKIVLTLKEVKPENPNKVSCKPYMVIKVKSKKPIEIL